MDSKRIRNEKIIGNGNIIGDDSTSRVVKQTTSGGTVFGTVHTGSGNIQIAGTPSEQDIIRLKLFSDYLLAASLSDINEQFILELEVFLRDFYRKAIENKWDSRLVSTIQSARTTSAYLSFIIKSNEHREPSYFEYLIRLEEEIRIVNLLLEGLSD